MEKIWIQKLRDVAQHIVHAVYGQISKLNLEELKASLPLANLS